MASVPQYTSALDAAVSKAKFTPEVQTAAEGINKETLVAAIDAALAMDETASSLEGEQAAALKKGFEFAVAVVKMLTKLPSDQEKLALYKYFKRGTNDTPKKPTGTFDFAGKYKYKEWEAIQHISDQRAQVLYIKEVDTLIEKYGTRDA